MLIRALILCFIAVSTQASAQEVCAGNNLRPTVQIGGFCVFGSQLTNEDSAFLSSKILSLEKRFPKLFSRVFAKGYHNILIQPAETGESGGTVLGEAIPEKKLLVLYHDFFIAEKQNQILQTLDYSVADIIIIHELMHALDDDNEIVRNNLQILGWNARTQSLIDGFQVAEIPEISNDRVTNAYIAKIKSKLGPLISKQGPWQIYIEARKRLLNFGYPTIYSVLGGPIETFAELGAYIALDPSVSSYVPAETVNWFKTQILQ